MPVDNAGEFLAASMMDPVQFMMEVPLDFGSVSSVFPSVARCAISDVS